MAKRSVLRRAALRPLALALATLWLAPGARADWKFGASADVQETYTDNVLLAPAEQARSQMVTTVRPSMTIINRGPHLDLQASYSKSLNHYSDTSLSGVRGNTQALQASAHAKLLEELLFLDATAGISQQAASAFGPQQAPAGGFGNVGNGFVQGLSNEVKQYRLSPSLRYKFGSWAVGELRYSHEYTATDNAALANSNADSVLLNLGSAAAFHRLGWGMNYVRQRFDNQQLRNTNSENLTLSLRYLVSEQLTALLNMGYDRYDYEVLPGQSSPNGKSWSLGANWVPSLRTSVQATAGRRYYGNSYALQANYRTRAMLWNISYNDQVTTTQSQFQQSNALDTAAFLDQLFAASVPDPVARRQVVQAYILANGLPPTLNNSINYFSNRYMLQKQLLATTAYSGVRSTLLLSLSSNRRSGLSLVDVDAGLLGSSNQTLNDDTRMSAATAVLNYRVSPRTGVNFSVNYMDARSGTLQRSDKTKSAALRLTREFAHQVQGSVDMRLTKGKLALGARNYTEHAVSASLRKQF